MRLAAVYAPKLRQCDGITQRFLGRLEKLTN